MHVTGNSTNISQAEKQQEWQKQNLKIWKEHIMIYFFARKFAIAGYETRFIGEKN